MMEGLTKKQEREFVRIHTGSVVLYTDLDFQCWDLMTEENLNRIQEMRTKEASKILRGRPAFSSTDEILNYVKKHY